MEDTIKSSNTYYLDFDTKTVPGKLMATRITVERVIINDMHKQMSINLCEDPNYKSIEDCIIMNYQPPK